MEKETRKKKSEEKLEYPKAEKVELVESSPAKEEKKLDAVLSPLAEKLSEQDKKELIAKLEKSAYLMKQREEKEIQKKHDNEIVNGKFIVFRSVIFNGKHLKPGAEIDQATKRMIESGAVKKV